MSDTENKPRKNREAFIKFIEGEEKAAGQLEAQEGNFQVAMAADIYEVIEKYVPDIEEALQKAIKEGRAPEGTAIADALARFVPSIYVLAYIGSLHNTMDDARRAVQVVDMSLMNAIKKNHPNPHDRITHPEGEKKKGSSISDMVKKKVLN